MAALTADKEWEMRDHGGIRRLLMKASATIYKGSLVVVDTTTGLAEAATEAANKIFAGIATKKVTSAASGSYYIEVWTSGVFRIQGSGTATVEQADVGKHCVVVDDNTVGDDADTATANIPVGIILERNSNTDVLVEIRPFGSPASTIAA